MDVERLLVSKIIATGDLTPVAESGITAEFFAPDPDNQSRKVFLDILAHKSQYGQVPTLAAIKADHPTYKFIKADEAYEYLTDKLREARMLAIIEEGLTNAVGAYEDKDPKSAMQVLAQTLSRIAEDVPHSRDTDLTQTTSERLERYKSYKDFDGGLRGIPSGFASIDRATLGFQNGQLVTMVGPPKAGKSTIELLAAMAAHDYGEEPLLIGFEMPNEEQEERFDAIFSRISHKRLRSGELRKPEWDRLESAMVRLKDMQAFLLSSDSNSATTLTGVASKIEVLQPTILFVDGVYMMDDENGERKGSPQALTNITRGFKRMAMNLDIPIVISTQALSYKVSKKDGITADSIGYSSSFAQDSDVIIGVNKTDDEDINEISIVLARNAPKMKTFVQWDWETGRFEELDDDPFGGDGDPDF